jgi:hypothetical protein
MSTSGRHGDGSSRSWLSFALGIAVGLALSGLVVAGALAEQRRARQILPWGRQRARRTAPLTRGQREPLDQWDSERTRAARHWPEDAELDEELEQTFPASDPLPYSHRVD